MSFTKDDVKRVIWTAVQAFVGTALVLAPGLFKAPNLEEAKALLISLLVAGVSAAFSAVKNLILDDGSVVK